MGITEKENLLRCINGQEPAWVPRKGAVQFKNDPENHKPACVRAMPVLFPPKRGANGGRIDIFGVEYEPVNSISGTQMPVPNKFILDDITRWRDVIKTPSLADIDWETVAKKSVEHVDRRESCVQLGTDGSFFQRLMTFMGFTEGLIAMHEEPEAVTELFDYLSDYYAMIAENLIEHIRPDIFGITDDTATARSPFISREMYQQLVKPFHTRIAKLARDKGIPVNMHNCGRCEDFIDDWRDFGVVMWDPAQIMNDLRGIKKKYGNRLVLTGCWDSSGPAGWPGAEESLVRQAVRDCIDAYAPGGGFCFWASVYGAKDDPQAETHAFWVTDEYNKYGRNFYKKMG